MTTETRLELTNPDAYKERLDTLRAGRPPLDVLAETAARLETLLAETDAAAWSARPFPDKWTPGEILGHYVDVEWTFGYRTRTALCDQAPLVGGIDQDRWVAEQRHHERQPADLLRDFRALREINLGTWRGLSGAALDRVARHQERGEETLGRWLEMLAGHDLWHLDQLERYLAATRA